MLLFGARLSRLVQLGCRSDGLVRGTARAPSAHCVCRNRPVPDDPGVTYTFVVDDVDRVYGDWRARGVAFDGPPALSEKFNVYSAFFRDPAGYRFEIQEFRDPAWPRPAV